MLSKLTIGNYSWDQYLTFRALALEPENECMLALVGKAMSTTHDYQATNDFYERIIQQNPQNTDINLDYASLLVKNNHFDVRQITHTQRAQSFVDMKIATGDDLEANLQNLKTSIKALKILAQICQKKLD